MKAILLFMPLLVVTGSCSLFKQTTKITDESRVQADQKIKLETNSNSLIVDKSQRLLFSKDSIKDNYSIRFWPKGMLKFSPYAGLEGQFDSVLMSGNLKISRNSSEVTNNNKEQKATISGNLDQKSSKNFWRNQEEKVSQWNWKWVITGIILLILGLVWFFRERIILKT